MLTENVTDHGNRIHARFPDAEKVFAMGSFNDWSHTDSPMRSVGAGRWELDLLSCVGEQELCFLIFRSGESRGRVRFDRLGEPQASPSQDGLADRPIKILMLIEAYRTQCTALPRGKREAIRVFERLIASTGAETLADLTEAKLTAFRGEMAARLMSPGSLAVHFGRIRNIIRFGGQAGLHAEQIEEALGRCWVLFKPQDAQEDESGLDIAGDAPAEEDGLEPDMDPASEGASCALPQGAR